ncbi:hypothetical protein C8F04DRAFT_267971 [Mycena alexandri]|uniref:Uncharacterized protein n=1 Tax=Mycena alexandri TaxID=1745969 RepID=A0AAD6S765_9AGAR|nr:hypothetical protein C8F04DRAFT_267971 [Mycena alexandri]
MAADNRRLPYAGTSRKLIISIDVGTTFTATSFCLLQPGNVPKFEEILRWPKQATPDAKVPSVLYYDRDGNPKAFGAETEDEDTIIEAEENGWFRAEWWKLLLRPSHLPIIQDLELPPLPANVTLDDVFSHHLGYVKDQVKTYITTTYGEGGSIWDALSPTMYIILTTPNGWEGGQQRRMREAAIRAGLVGVTGGRRVKFVSEAEAAVLYAADSGSVGDWLVADGQLILCDCGGGTVDITGYKIDATKPVLKLSESSASRCYLAGAVFVTQAAKKFFQARLQGTEWEKEESMQRIVNHFDRNAKKKFTDETMVSYVQLDGHKSNPNLNITRGRLKITGTEMASFFADPLQKIQEGLEIAFENGDRLADKVILVGGLASSPYVFSKLDEWGKGLGISVTRPDGPTVKAVANGALAWHLDGSVESRVAKYHYGITVRRPYVETDPNCVERIGTKYQAPNGKWYIPHGWAGIVKKNDKLEAAKEFAAPFFIEMEERTFDFEHSVKLYVYRRSTPPAFATFPGRAMLQPGFEVICQVTGDLEKCYQATELSVSETNRRYKRVCFEVCLTLGETELAARLRWKEDGVETYGLATLAYE